MQSSCCISSMHEDLFLHSSSSNVSSATPLAFSCHATHPPLGYSPEGPSCDANCFCTPFGSSGTKSGCTSCSAESSSERLCGSQEPQVAGLDSCESSPQPPRDRRLRAGVVNWLVQACYMTYLPGDTLFLAVACYDRCCSKAPTTTQLSSAPTEELLALACLWVAAKYQDHQAPAAHTLLQCCSHPYSTQQLVAAERWVLCHLGYRLSGVGTIKEGLHAIMTAHQQLQLPCPPQLYHMASYIAELALLEAALLDTPPLLVAAAAYWYAQALLSTSVEDQLLQQVAGCTVSDIQEVTPWLCALHATVTQAAASGAPMYSSTAKYLLPEYKQVARIGESLLLAAPAPAP